MQHKLHQLNDDSHAPSSASDDSIASPIIASVPNVSVRVIFSTTWDQNPWLIRSARGEGGGEGRGGEGEGEGGGVLTGCNGSQRIDLRYYCTVNYCTEVPQ